MKLSKSMKNASIYVLFLLIATGASESPAQSNSTFSYDRVSLGAVANSDAYTNLEFAESMLKTRVENALSDICNERYGGYIEYDTVSYEVFEEGHNDHLGETRTYMLRAISPSASCRHRNR